jgi:heme/copper-type cytochrome/quinol oxidase subunit 2
MPLDLNALVAWIIVTFVFIGVIGVLYRKITRARAKKQEADERKDETPAY